MEHEHEQECAFHASQRALLTAALVYADSGEDDSAEVCALYDAAIVWAAEFLLDRASA
jgi:hypothetical protein